ncbi:MAG: LysM peptidoglycan-binding domain-containing protein [Anaerolineae bacterium]
MLTRFVRVGMVAVFLAATFLAVGGSTTARAGESASVVESVVREADITAVVDLIQGALIDHHGLSLEDQAIVYGAIGRTNRAIDLLYDTGATGDAFTTAEDLLLTQLDLLHEVEFATLSEDLDDLNAVVVMLVDVAQRRLAFERQMGNFFTPLGAAHSVSVVDIARDDAAVRVAMARVITALATGQPVGLEISDEVYRALGETSRALDLVDETFETGDVFEAAVGLLDHRFEFLVNLEEAVISGDLDDLRFVAEDWVKLSQHQLIFERQLVARDTNRAGRTFLDRRRSSFFSRSGIGNTGISLQDTHTQIRRAQDTTQVVTVKVGDTLGSIARQYNTTVEALARQNNISDPNQIDVGMALVIPVVATHTAR